MAHGPLPPETSLDPARCVAVLEAAPRGRLEGYDFGMPPTGDRGAGCTLNSGDRQPPAHLSAPRGGTVKDLQGHSPATSPRRHRRPGRLAGGAGIQGHSRRSSSLRRHGGVTPRAGVRACLALAAAASLLLAACGQSEAEAPAAQQPAPAPAPEPPAPTPEPPPEPPAPPPEPAPEPPAPAPEPPPPEPTPPPDPPTPEPEETQTAEPAPEPEETQPAEPASPRSPNPSRGARTRTRSSGSVRATPRGARARGTPARA